MVSHEFPHLFIYNILNLVVWYYFVIYVKSNDNVKHRKIFTISKISATFYTLKYGKFITYYLFEIIILIILFLTSTHTSLAAILFSVDFQEW